MSILRSLVDVIHIVHPKLRGLHFLPTWRESLPLQRVAPVRSVGVVVDVVLPAADSPVYGPTSRQGEVLSSEAGQVPQRLGLYPTNAWEKQTTLFYGRSLEVWWNTVKQLWAKNTSGTKRNIWQKYFENMCGNVFFTAEECVVFKRSYLPGHRTEWIST